MTTRDCEACASGAVCLHHSNAAATATGLATADNELLRDAAGLVIGTQRGSASMLCRRLRLSFATASRLMNALEANGVVGPLDEGRPREVLVKYAQLGEVLASLPGGGES